MKILKMRGRGLAMTALLMMTAALSVSASAASISSFSEIALIGGTYTPTGGTGLADATGINAAPSLIAGGANDFAFAVGSMATFSPFDFTTGGAVFTFASGGSFTATSISIDLQTAVALDVSMTGIYSLDGFDDTAGTFVFTSDALGGLFTYSGVGRIPEPIPVPGALLLFGSALAGLGLTRRSS
ncbi:MAG: hypothetical protein HKN70_01615 [Gammaproteobacteria bacterium]|nr:hypothetical protein [Gammaproteobacteria bacterium]